MPSAMSVIHAPIVSNTLFSAAMLRLMIMQRHLSQVYPQPRSRRLMARTPVRSTRFPNMHTVRRLPMAATPGHWTTETSDPNLKIG